MNALTVKSKWSELQIVLKQNAHEKVLGLTKEILEFSNMWADVQWIQGMAHLARGDANHAVMSLRNAASIAKDPKRYLVAAKVCFGMGQQEEGLERLKECLKLAPDDTKCASLHSHMRKMQKSLDQCNKEKEKGAKLKAFLKELDDLKAAEEKGENKWSLVDIDTLSKAPMSHGDIYKGLKGKAAFGLCQASVASEDGKEANQWCQTAFELDSGNISVISARVDAFVLNGAFEEAKRFVESLEKTFSGDSEILGKLASMKQRIEKELAKPTDYYKVLGLKRGEKDMKKIKKAYRTLAQKWHPDLNEDKELANREMSRINQAYEILGDEEAKQKYDMYDIDPNNHNQQGNPFGGFGGNPFGGGGFDMNDLFRQFGGGAQKKDKKKSQQGGFPFGDFGGFHFDL